MLNNISLALMMSILLFVQSAHAEMNVGVLVSLTGRYAEQARAMRAGIQLAIDNVNASGGILGSQVKMIIVDDKSDAREAYVSSSRMVGERVVAVFGGLYSSLAISAAECLNRNNVLFVTPWAENPKISDGQFPKVFRLARNNDPNVTARVASRLGKAVGNKVYVVYQQGASEDVSTMLKRDNLNVSVVEFSKEGIDSMVRSMNSSETSVVLNLADEEVSSELFMAAISNNRKIYVLQYKYKDYLSVDPARSFWGRLPSNLRESFVNSDDKRLFLQSYASVQVWAEAVRRCRSIDPVRVSDEIKRGQYNTVVGDLNFSNNGNVCPNCIGSHEECGTTNTQCPQVCRDGCEVKDNKQCCTLTE